MNKLDQIQKQEHYMKNKLIIILILFHLILLIFITINKTNQSKINGNIIPPINQLLNNFHENKPQGIE